MSFSIKCKEKTLANADIEEHPHWQVIVNMSYFAGLGNKGVDNLGEKLFPIDRYPHRYDSQGRYIGGFVGMPEHQG